MHLLSLLSILPDGLADSDLQQSDIVPIEDILTCKATLLRTSLGYVTSDHPPRLKLLAPIREYLAKMYPPMHSHVHSLQEHFHQLLKIYSNNFGYAAGASAVKRLTSNRGNLRSVLLLGLNPMNNPDQIKATVEAVIALNHFNRLTGQGGSDTMRRLPAALTNLRDDDLDARFVTEILNSWLINPQRDAESFIADGQRALSRMNNPTLESAFISQVGEYYRVHRNEFSLARNHFERAIALGAVSGDTNTRCSSHVRFAWLLWQEGNYTESQIHSQEAQRLAELAGSLFPQIRALHIEAMACICLADYKRSASLCQRARTLLDLCGITEGIAVMSLMNAEAEITLLKTEYGAAREIQAEIVSRSSAERTPFSLAFAQLNIASIDSIIGASSDEVLKNINGARSLFRTVTVPTGLAYCDMVEADLNLREGNFVAARSVLEKNFVAYYGKSSDFTMYCLERLGDPTPWGSRERVSSTWTFVFMAQAAQAGRKLELLVALRCLGDVFVSVADTRTGEYLFRVALDGFARMDIHRRRAECLQRLGDIFVARGDRVGAVEVWKEARSLFERSMQFKNVDQIDAKLGRVEAVEELDGSAEWVQV
ncbi:hypothetical protein FB45DRAFT_1059633 [Roridomyces roridus]|uniref:Anaphase-promoting complex subunit 5 n=1 Tax=Roridomyces roridus TaxID=1738132 RepID=A0AAD7BS44_9AGAR|nr:hypothetical protein FB45DRAFT_1059633 [Roridomyces roridus]